MNTLNCTSPIKACVESTSFNIFFFSFICLVNLSGMHTNKKLVISAFETDFFFIFMGFKNRRSHLNIRVSNIVSILFVYWPRTGRKSA